MLTRTLAFVLLFSPAAFASDLRLTGRVTDETGGALEGARVEVTSAAGKTKAALTAASGEYAVAGLAPGTYVVMVSKARFSPYANGAVVLDVGKAAVLDATLTVSLEEHVTVDDRAEGLSVDANNNSGQKVWRESDLEALPDDPDELQKALQALAGPTVGPDGVAFEVDGFSNGRVPPKSQIREIRFNRNPFAAEHDAQMSGGFEITTKGGTGKMAGMVEFGFADDALNARNPYVQTRPPYQRHTYNADISGPLVKDKLSFALSVGDNLIDENDLINATVLDPELRETPLAMAVVSGSETLRVTPRLDWQMTPTHSLMVKYAFDAVDRTNAGVGEFALPSRAYDRKNGNQSFSLVESGAFGQVASAFRLQYTRRRTRLLGGLEDPALEVMDAFTSGGSQVGQSTSLRQTWEIGEVASWAVGSKHTIRVGGRVRGTSLDDISQQNFGGTVTFSGGPAPVLDANDALVLDGAGQVTMAPITSLERYRRTLALQRRGLSADEIRRRGGGASQLRIAGGNPTLAVSQWDVGVFAQHDWKPIPDLQLSLGLRYENQTNVSSPLNIAPRVYVSWGPKPKGSKEPPKTVFSAGLGVFYDRVPEDFTLQARRFDGESQQQFVIADAAVLDRLSFGGDGVSGLPSTETLTGFEVPQTRRRLADDLEAPYRYQGMLSVERQIRKGLKATVMLRHNRFYRMFRSEVVPTDEGRMYEFESDGRRFATWYSLGIEGKPHAVVTLNVNFMGGRVRTDSDGPQTFPANARDLAAEWGPAAWDFRRGGWGSIEVKPKGGWRFAVWAYGRGGGAFNITTGRDNNGDGVYSDRPALATDPSKPGVVSTRWGLLDPNPGPGDTIIPRNFGRAHPEFFTDISMGKSFGFGKAPASAAPSAPAGASANTPAAGAGAGGSKQPPAPKPRYVLDVRTYVRNVFNSTNAGTPVGNLTSPLFAQSTRGGGPRTVNLGIKLTF